MEIIIRKLNIYSDAASMSVMTNYKPLGEVNLVMATANTDTSGTLQNISAAYRWDNRRTLTAAKKVNKRKKVAILYGNSQNLILVPKCGVKDQATNYIDDVIYLIENEDNEILSITHFAYIENFPREHIDIVVNALPRFASAGVRVVYLDIEHKFYDIVKSKIDDLNYQLGKSGVSQC